MSPGRVDAGVPGGGFSPVARYPVGPSDAPARRACRGRAACGWLCAPMMSASCAADTGPLRPFNTPPPAPPPIGPRRGLNALYSASRRVRRGSRRVVAALRTTPAPFNPGLLDAGCTARGCRTGDTTLSPGMNGRRTLGFGPMRMASDPPRGDATVCADRLEPAHVQDRHNPHHEPTCDPGHVYVLLATSVCGAARRSCPQGGAAASGATELAGVRRPPPWLEPA